MLNYNHLYYFHVTASEGSLSAAAEKLGVTLSTVSEQLRSLEKFLGMSLIERRQPGLRLTQAGKLAFEHTSTMFRAGRRLEEALGVDRGRTPQTLRVGISGAVARSTSTDFLLPLFALEGATPSIITGETLDLLRELHANELDLVLSETEPSPGAIEGMQHAVVSKVPLVAIGPAGCAVSEDWSELGLIQYHASSTYYWEVVAFLESRELRPRIAGEADDPLLLLEAVARGDGLVAVVPRAVARDAIAAGRICVVADLDLTHAAVHAIYQSGASADLARKAIEQLVDRSK